MTDDHQTGAAELTPHADSAPEADHAATHMDLHAHLSDDDHGHAEPRLGPIDWAAWGYGIVGIAAGLVVVFCFWLAVGG